MIKTISVLDTGQELPALSRGHWEGGEKYVGNQN